MKRKGIEPNEVRKYFLITGAFLIFMIGSLSFFLSWLQKDVEINSQKNVATNVERHIGISVLVIMYMNSM